MSLLTPPPSQPQRGVRSVFAGMVDGFVAWLCNTFYPQVLALVSSLNTLAVGGAYAIPYIVDLSSTADADPTAGLLRFNGATQNAATMIYLDLLGSDGVDYTRILDTFDTSSSIVKGQLRIVKMGDPTHFLTFNVTARTTVTGYRKLTLVNTGSSSASPFGAGDGVMLQFQRTGDKGDQGLQGVQGNQGIQGIQGIQGLPGGVVRLASTAIANGVSAVDFLNVFTSNYDKYSIELENVQAASGTVGLQFANAGVVDNTSGNYYDPAAAGVSMPMNFNTYLKCGNVGPSNANSMNATVQVRNANSAAYKSIGINGGSNLSAIALEGAYVAAAACSGFRLMLSSGNFVSGTIRVYGHSNS